MSGFGRGMPANRPLAPNAFPNPSPGASFLSSQPSYLTSSYRPPNPSIAKYPRLETAGSSQHGQQPQVDAMEWEDALLANLEWTQDVKLTAAAPVLTSTARPAIPASQQQRFQPPVHTGTRPATAKTTQNIRFGAPASTQQSQKWTPKTNTRPSTTSSAGRNSTAVPQMSPMPPPVPQTSMKHKVPVRGPPQALPVTPAASPSRSAAGETKTVRVFTGSVSHLAQWMSLKRGNILLFVTIAKLEWTLSSLDKPTENWFVIGDHPRIVQALPELAGKPLRKVEAVYYNIDGPYLNPAAGSTLLCFGRFIKHKSRKDPVFQVIKMRQVKDVDLQGFMRQFQQSLEQVQALSPH